MVIFEECTTLLRNSFLNITLKENGSALHRDLVGVVSSQSCQQTNTCKCK